MTSSRNPRKLLAPYLWFSTKKKEKNKKIKKVKIQICRRRSLSIESFNSLHFFFFLTKYKPCNHSYYLAHTLTWSMSQVCNLPYYTLTFGVHACTPGQAFLVSELSSTFPPNCHARKISHLWMKKKVEGKVNFFEVCPKNKKRSYSPTLLSYKYLLLLPHNPTPTQAWKSQSQSIVFQLT